MGKGNGILSLHSPWTHIIVPGTQRCGQGNEQVTTFQGLFTLEENSLREVHPTAQEAMVLPAGQGQWHFELAQLLYMF